MTAKKPKAVKAWAVVHDNKISVWTIRPTLQDAKNLLYFSSAKGSPGIIPVLVTPITKRRAK